MKNAGYGRKLASRRGVFGHAMSPFLILLGIFCLLFPAKGLGQSSNRWLFIFNTSAAMRDRARGVEAVTEDLLTTAMHGNMRSGDTVGIWTYNKELRSEEAPLQIWDPEMADSVTGHTLEFLSRHRYANTAAFGDVLTNMFRVIKISDVITVILVSDGSDPIKGTPFDARLSAFYKKNYQSQKKAHMPVVTIFRGVAGRITTNTLSLAPWPVDMPLIPPPAVPRPVIAKAATPKPGPVPNPPPAPLVPSLVIIGKKAENVLHPLADYPDVSPPAPTTQPAAAPAQPVTEPASAPKVVPGEEPKPAAVSVEPVSATASSAPAEVPPVEAPKSAEPAMTSTSIAPASEPTVKSAAPSVQPWAKTVATAPPQNLFSARNIAIVSVAFAVGVCGLLLLTARRSRRASQASLITRSLDREGK
jgi:hypothetical protein